MFALQQFCHLRVLGLRRFPSPNDGQGQRSIRSFDQSRANVGIVSVIATIWAWIGCVSCISALMCSKCYPGKVIFIPSNATSI